MFETKKYGGYGAAEAAPRPFFVFGRRLRDPLRDTGIRMHPGEDRCIPERTDASRREQVHPGEDDIPERTDASKEGKEAVECRKRKKGKDIWDGEF